MPAVTTISENQTDTGSAADFVCALPQARLAEAPVNPAVPREARALFGQFGHAPGLIESLAAPQQRAGEVDL